MKTGKDNSNRLNEAIALSQRLEEYDPETAQTIQYLVGVIEEMDKVQTGLISLAVRLKRSNNHISKVLNRVYMTMSRGQQNIVDVWMEGKVL